MRPNLWMCLIAPSSIGRKSTSLAIGRRVYEEGLPGMTYPSEFTGEAFMEILSGNPEGLMFASEFLTLVGSVKKPYNEGLMGFLADMYDCPPSYTRTLRSRTFTIENPAVNILAATTVEWFLEKLTPEDWAGGFVPRFMLVPALDESRELVALPPPADDMERRRLANLLIEMRDAHGEMTLTDEARAFYEEWYSRHVTRNELPAMFHGTYHRMSVQALKLAMVYRVASDPRSVRGTAIMEREDIAFGCGCVDELCDGLGILNSGYLAFTRHEKNRNKILAYLGARGGKAPHSAVLRASGLDAAGFRRVLETMVEEEVVVEVMEQTRTKPRRMYRLNRPNDED